MYFWDWILAFFKSDYVLTVCFFMAFGCIFLFAILAVACKNMGVYLALCTASFCGLCLVLMSQEKSLRAGGVCALLLGIWASVCYVMATLLLFISAKRKAKKAERARILRQLQYTLPDKDNSYVRARLNTALRTPTDYVDGVEKERENSPVLRLEYVRKLLTAVRNAPLSHAERVEAEEMTRLFSAYIAKSKWTPEDVRVINDLFSRLLKLSAKYAV